MKSRTWKIITVTFIILILFMYGLQKGFHSYYQPDYFTYPSGNNGTVVVMAALSNVNVNGKIMVTYSGPQNGHAVVTLQNGTNIVFNDTIYLYFHFLKQYSGVTSSNILLNSTTISLDAGKPMDSGIIYNISVTAFLHGLPGTLSRGGGNFYIIYIYGYAQVAVTMESGSL